MDENGRILLADKGRISANPDGSGGCFRALKESGGLKDMRRRGIRWIFFYGVDNALVRVCDPYFIGFAKEQDKDVASKTVRKTHSAEHVGVYAYRNDAPSIIEYTELPQELAEATLPSGKLLYGSGNIINHVLKLDFLEKALHFEAAYHVAHKVVETVDEAGQKVRSITPNAYKFEALYFDLFRHAQDMALLDVERREEFAPVKNFEGVDSKDTARQMVLALCTSWVRALGLTPHREVELSPLLCMYGKELEANDLQERLDASPNGAIE